MSDFMLKSLTEIIDVQVLQEVQDKFAIATGLAAVMADEDGNPITKPSCFSRLCMLIRSKPEAITQCQLSDSKLGIKGNNTRSPAMGHCHAGLVDLAAPIVVNGVFLGSVLCGQVLIKDEDDREWVAANLAKLGQSYKEITQMLSEIPEITRDKLRASGDLLQIMAKYIVSIGLTSLNEKLINHKNLQLMEEEAAHINLENMLKTMELKALQSHVNPHFLFNALNTIARLAMIEGAQDTERVTYSLSQLLRYTLREIDQNITLKDEIDHVKEYLIIQEFRYGNRVKSCIEISDFAAQLKLPAMTIQPLVENAIVHGLEPKVEGGTITIKAQETGDMIKVIVEDDGIGMTEKRLQEICQPGAARSGLGHTTAIGFLNVMDRLRYHFGKRFFYSVTSEILKGTRVELHCPLFIEV